MSKHPLYCSFCGKSDNQVVHMVAGPTVYICNECVDLCQDIIKEQMAHQGKTLDHEPMKEVQDG